MMMLSDHERVQQLFTDIEDVIRFSLLSATRRIRARFALFCLGILGSQSSKEAVSGLQRSRRP